MKCPKCHIENPNDNKFCRECGNALLAVCAKCGNELQAGDKFCGKCGQKVVTAVKDDKAKLTTEGERKHVTVLFSDLSGYTTMSEKLDPEEVKEFTGRIFGQVSKIIAKYEGFVEKYAGDAVMALFGVPNTHEDDPIRAIKAAREIHECVEAFSPEIENKIGQPIAMHSGINTGLVVTGELDMARGTHGVAGDTINVAARLSQIAHLGEVLVDSDTYLQAEGFFDFESLEPTLVRGRAEPVKVHRVLSVKDKPITIRRLSGVRADLVGRKAEMAELSEAVENLHKGRGRIFSISGDAGTGKSRLVEEFKATLNLEEIQWLEGHAYGYAQNIPYFPVIDLLRRVFHIEEGDAVESLQEKLESGIKQLVEDHVDVIPYVGGLYSLSYPEVEQVSPEFWKSSLHEAIHAILTALAKRRPTVFFLEDLHWADPSFVELLRHACLTIRQPAIVLCVYRPTFSLFTSHQVSNIGKLYQEVQLEDLSRSEAQEMVQLLLKSEKVPSDLQRFVQDKMEGNPFYLEEAVNTLIESNTLFRDNGDWRVTKQISEANISSTIQGVIAARVDRLEQESKRILQEAAVIGRSFYYEILKRITELKKNIDNNLSILERLDLIKTKTIQPELEYLFKHALTQEVVYKGLLKKERREIHERIGQVIEELFKNRLPEFYETLAFHFRRSRSVRKAIDYLMRSGEKSLKRYAVEESHKYYQEAYDLLMNQPGLKLEEIELRINLLIKWALVYYYRGDFRGLTTLFEENLGLAETIADKCLKGMFYAWLGATLTCRARFEQSYEFLKKALAIGDKHQDERLNGFVCCWLPWCCSGLGLLDDAIIYGERAQEISTRLPSDQYIYFKSLGGLGIVYYHRGEKKKVLDLGKKLVDFGREHSSIRSQAMGLWTLGLGYVLEGDLKKAIEYLERSVQTAADPFYAEFPRAFLGIALVMNGQWEIAEKSLNKTIKFARYFGAEVQERWVNIYLGIVLVARGQMNNGINLIKETRQSLLGNNHVFFSNVAEYVLGKIYLQMVEKSEPISLSTMTKNIGFLLKTLPVAAKKAEAHFLRVIEISKKYGSKSFMGYACLDLARLYKTKKRNEKAREYLFEAIRIFEECEMNGFLAQARKALDSLNV
jgi:class 3 adenylate cyclase/tetratricopeptide (TPR) repeat protein